MGAITVYRWIPLTAQPAHRQVPTHYVERLPEWQTVESAFSNGQDVVRVAHHLRERGVPAANINKVLAELATESVRRQSFPDRPSRLNCLYAFLDPIEAVGFSAIRGESGSVFEATTSTSSRWHAVPFPTPFFIQPATPDESGERASWQAMVDRAFSYWNMPLDTEGPVELLVEGDLGLVGNGLNIWDLIWR
jgi:hypothetical protein